MPEAVPRERGAVPGPDATESVGQRIGACCESAASEELKAGLLTLGMAHDPTKVYGRKGGGLEELFGGGSPAAWRQGPRGTQQLSGARPPTTQRADPRAIVAGRHPASRPQRRAARVHTCSHEFVARSLQSRGG